MENETNNNEPRTRYSYQVIFDNGKPFENWFNTDESLKEALRDFYLLNKDSNNFYDVAVYRDGEDISESQHIQEIIAEILEEQEELNNSESQED